MSNAAKKIEEGGPVLLRDDGGEVCTLTLNRPRQFNALSEPLLDELQDSFDSIAKDPDIRVVVLAASGKAFCAGHDLKEMRANRNQAWYEALFKKCGRMMLTMRRIPQPVIARVHGMATAAGCQLVANADLAVASNNAKLATSGIDVGLFCMTPGVALSRNVSAKHAFEMLFTGEFIPAERAAEIGLVNRAVAPDTLDAKISEFAAAIISKPECAVTAGKRVFYRQIEKTMEDAYNYAAEEMSRNMMFDDTGEGIDAFIGKRSPDWRRK